MRLCIAKVFTALSLLSQLHAQDENAELTRQFQRFDQDADGLLLRKEFPGSDRQFALLDADKTARPRWLNICRAKLRRLICEPAATMPKNRDRA